MPGLFDGTPLQRPVTCEHCGQTHGKCTCPRNTQGKVVTPKDQHPRVRREKRRGKMTTVIAGLDLKQNALKELLQELKPKLGAGGTVNDDNEIEIQGDHRDKLVELLKSRGYQVKAAGG